MQPSPLAPLFRDLRHLRGVGPASLQALSRLLSLSAQLSGGLVLPKLMPTVRDLLWHTPVSYIDRRQIHTIAELRQKQLATLRVTVHDHDPGARFAKGRKPYRIYCTDATGDITLVFFSPRTDYLAKQLPPGQERIISGVVEAFDGVWQMAHPDIIALPSQQASVLRVEPVYPLTMGISGRQLGKWMQQVVESLPELPEWIDPSLLAQRSWPSWRESWQQIHQPAELPPVDASLPAYQRAAYDELLANQLSLCLARERIASNPAPVIAQSRKLAESLQLPFRLTQGQRTVLKEIHADMASGKQMMRLLQGDVGSGKTIVALEAMLSAVEAGYQAVIMAPTDLLARQHAQSFSRLLEPLGLRCGFLSGKLKKKEKEAIQADIASGALRIVVGTHALFQQEVAFDRLGLVVIDEQHRFGVEQRLQLTEKGVNPHILLMTATPIPRSLAMTAYGDMESSQLTEKPAGRTPVDTRAVPLHRSDEVIEGLRRALSQGAKAYWICPLVDESSLTLGMPDSATDLAAAEERYQFFRQLLGDRVGLVHGRMKPAEREEEMQGFAGDRYDLLVATTVVEVGVDVPEATIMVIEHAERFGLSQLHQLRGRVGRSERASSCLLLYAAHCGEVARKRLSIIRECHDGFRIAEEDLILRGPGDVLGTRQSGSLDFRFADLGRDRELLAIARQDARHFYDRDPELESPRGQALRLLLQLFGHDEAMRYFKAA